MDPEFPSMHLRTFVAVMFRHCPLLQDYTKEDEERAFQAFMEYKTRVPVRGAIMLNERMDEVVLVKGWKKGASWSFPRGKIDQDELDLACAIREVYEETGYDLKEAGLVGGEDEKSIDVQIRGQDIKMYVFRGIPMDTVFEPKTRKEISKVQWHRLSELPTVKTKKPQQQGHGEDLVGNANKFYMVAPFLGPLKRWIAQQRKKEKSRAVKTQTLTATSVMESTNALSEQETMDEQAEREDSQQEHLQRLLSTLRSSGQAVTSDLPEVTHDPTTSYIVNTKEAQAEDLKAALFGQPPTVARLPRTPFNQVIEEPQFPSSPTHRRPHDATQLIAPPLFSMQPPQTRDAHLVSNKPPTSFGHAIPGQPQVRPIPPPALPARMVPRSSETVSISIKDKIFPPTLKVNDLHTRPPIDLPSPVAPPASQLPTPKLNPHKAALLGLFKTQPSAAPSKPEDPIETSAAASKSFPTDVGSLPPNPSQSSRNPSEAVPLTGRPPSAHQAKLLEILRGPPATAKSSTLEPPEPAVELSASPTGSRSRNASTTAERATDLRPPSKHALLGQVKIQKRPPREEGPVSATVSGPLNIPHFDMIRSSSGEKGPLKDKHEPAKVSPVQILSRPSSSHAHLSSPSPISTARSRDSSLKQKAKASSLVPAANTLEPSPADSKAHEPAQKVFQPQILRRPQNAKDSNGIVPTRPLHPAQHQPPSSHNAVLQDEHKKSLLSHFMRPSPVVSPPSGAIEPGRDISAIISPIENPTSTPPPPGKIAQTPGDQIKPAVTTHENHPYQPLVNARDRPSDSRKKFYAPDRMPTSLTQPNAANGQIPNGAATSAAPTKGKANPSTVSAISPANQEYLLGFLKGLK